MPLSPAGEDTVEIHGYALRELRVTKGRKVQELADEVGVDRSYIARIEVGLARRVSRVFYFKLVKSLGVQDDRALLAHAPRREDAA